MGRPGHGVVLFAALVAVLAALLTPGTRPPADAVTAVPETAAVASPGAPAIGYAGTDRPDDACTDRAGSWLGTRWRTPMRWRFDAATVPAYLGGRPAVRDLMERAAHNVSAAVNPCGLRRRPALAQRYTGGTAVPAAVRPDGTCGTHDGVSEVAFGRLRPGLLAVTCLWWRHGRHGRDNATAEADILISDQPGLFFATVPVRCRGGWDLEGTVTHEFGHAFGLGHVSAVRHAALTMSDALAACDTSHHGLGRGDYDMLRAHY